MTVAEESDPNTEEGETAAAEEEDNEPQETQTEVMEVTPLHPIYVEGEGWLNAENLEAGDSLRLADGGMAKVLAIEHQQLSTPAVVYTFTVATFHTYFVLDLQVLVHNVSDDKKCYFYPETNQWRDEKGRYAKEPNEVEVLVFAFQGVGFSDLPDDFINEHGLIKAGHIGYSFDGGKTIYGFHPHKEASNELLKEGIDPLDFLKNDGGGAIRGAVQDDTKVFLRAQQLAANNKVVIRVNKQGIQTTRQTTVYALKVTMPSSLYKQKYTETLKNIENTPYPSWYRFPDPNENIPMPNQCNNCVTWAMRTLGIADDTLTGNVRQFMPMMKTQGIRWVPRKRK